MIKNEQSLLILFHKVYKHLPIKQNNNNTVQVNIIQTGDAGKVLDHLKFIMLVWVGSYFFPRLNMPS